MNKKGFTLVELIAIIVIVSIIMILSFTSFTNTLKKTQMKEITDFEDSLINAATVHIEGHISDYPELSEPGSTKKMTVQELIDEGYLEEDIINPGECTIENTYVEVKKQADYTIGYTVGCSN